VRSGLKPRRVFRPEMPPLEGVRHEPEPRRAVFGRKRLRVLVRRSSKKEIRGVSKLMLVHRASIYKLPYMTEGYVPGRIVRLSIDIQQLQTPSLAPACAHKLIQVVLTSVLTHICDIILLPRRDGTVFKPRLEKPLSSLQKLRLNLSMAGCTLLYFLPNTPRLPCEISR